MRIFHDNAKDDHSYTKGRQPPQRLQPWLRQLPGDIPRHRFPLCAAAPKRYDYTIGYVNTVVSRACAELRLQSKNADKDTDCILISVLIWRRRRDLNPRCGFPHYSLSRGAPSATWVLLQGRLCSDDTALPENELAEREGFEPPVPFGITGFQDQRLQPLGHLSSS